MSCLTLSHAAPFGATDLRGHMIYPVNYRFNLTGDHCFEGQKSVKGLYKGPPGRFEGCHYECG